MEALTDSLSLSDKVALVTGASSGLGEHFAHVLAEAGATVVVAARRRDKLDKLVEEIVQQGGKAYAISMDVTDPESVEAAFDEIEQSAGVVQVLVNNAGVAPAARFLNTDEASWEVIVETNLRAVWRITRLASSRMVAAGIPGSIINISSILGVQPGLDNSLYGTAKAGVIQLTKSAAMELWRKNIRVNALCPGYFKTELNQDFFQSEKGQQYIARIPPRRLGKMEELNMPLLMLASDAGSFITGVALPVDGGHLVQSL